MDFYDFSKTFGKPWKSSEHPPKPMWKPTSRACHRVSTQLHIGAWQMRAAFFRIKKGQQKAR